jgi:hypothetical protein
MAGYDIVWKVYEPDVVRYIGRWKNGRHDVLLRETGWMGACTCHERLPSTPDVLATPHGEALEELHLRCFVETS